MRRTANISKVLGLQFSIVAVLGFLAIGNLYGQNEDKAPAKREKARISLEYSNINNNGPRLSATVKTKIERSYVSVPGVDIVFYLDSISSESMLGKAVTGGDGQAVYLLPETLRKVMLKKHEFLYIAAIENSDKFIDSDTDIEIHNSFIDLTFEEEDSVRALKVFFGTPDSIGNMIPVEDVELNVYVQRLFGLLPVFEDAEYTDEDGELIVSFPDDIPGGENGILKIIVQAEEHELFGTVKSIKEKNWGSIVDVNSIEIKNTLWSTNANAPLLLIITVSLIVLGIWGVIGYIIYLLFRIYSNEKQSIALE